MDLNEFDLSSKSDEGTDMTLRHPTTFAPLTFANAAGEEEPITIRLAGVDSKYYRRATQANANNRLKGGRFKTPQAEQLEAEGIELLVRCTLAWKGVRLEGAELPCTPQNARMVYTRFPWIKEQVSQWIDDRSNFMPTSQTS